jgi:hypothetical protein
MTEAGDTGHSAMAQGRAGVPEFSGEPEICVPVQRFENDRGCEPAAPYKMAE